MRSWCEASPANRRCRSSASGRSKPADELLNQAHELVMEQPILRKNELEKLCLVSHDVSTRRRSTSTGRSKTLAGIKWRLQLLCEEAERYVEDGAKILILSDRNLGAERVAMPSLLAVAAVHDDLVRAGTRRRTGLVIENGGLGASTTWRP